MFGRRAMKKAEQEALRKMMEEAEANRRAAQEAEYAAEQEAKVFYESEIIFDDDHDDLFYDYQYESPQDAEEDFPASGGGVIVALPIHEDKPEEKEEVFLPEGPIEPASEPVYEGAERQESAQEAETVVEDIPEPVSEPISEPVPEQAQGSVYEYAEQSTAEPDIEPEIRYVVDGPIDDDELVKPAKLVKLPNLIDYMLTLKMSKRVKINVAMLLLGAYEKFKDIPEEKEIVVGCMKKIMVALMH